MENAKIYSGQVFPLCKFRRNFCKLSIVQKYFKNQMIDKAVTTCKISKLILLSYVILTGFFCKKLRKNLGEMFMHFLGKMIWEKNPCYKRIFFATEQINPLCQFCCIKGTDFCKSSDFPFMLKEAVKFFIQCFIKHRVLFTIHHFNVLNSILYWLDEKIYTFDLLKHIDTNINLEIRNFRV